MHHCLKHMHLLFDSISHSRFLLFVVPLKGMMFSHSSSKFKMETLSVFHSHSHDQSNSWRGCSFRGMCDPRQGHQGSSNLSKTLIPAITLSCKLPLEKIAIGTSIFHEDAAANLVSMVAGGFSSVSTQDALSALSGPKSNRRTMANQWKEWRCLAGPSLVPR